MHFIFLIVQFNSSMRFGNSKQKLVLNRIRKPLEFQRLSMQAQPMIKQQNHQLPLVKKDLNLVNGNNNSSIFRKQTQPNIQSIFKSNTSAIRCRSLSSVQFHRRIASKAAPIIEQKPLKLQQTNSEPHEDESTWGQDISEILSQISSDFKSRGVLTLKNNRFWINCDDFKQLTKCIGEKILSQKQKIEKQSKLRELSASQASTIAQAEKKNTLAVQNCVLLYNQIIKKHKNLSINSKIHQHSLIVEPSSEHQQLSWKVIQDIQTHRITPELLLRIAEKIKSFRIQSCIQQLKVKELSKKKEQLLQAIDEQTASLDSCNRLIKQKQQFLEKIDKSAKEMQSYLKSQPNKILQQEAEGYKKSEQQLFDLAFMLEQSSPESLEAFVEENIIIPNQGFKFQLKSFPSQQLCEGQKYVITQEEMQKFKCTMANIFASLISKFKSLLERKHLKVKKFVGIMRQLASYTIGKRQYLAEINKKMVIVSVKTEGNLQQLKICAQRSYACSESIAAIEHLREMFELIKKTYYQAQLFY